MSRILSIFLCVVEVVLIAAGERPNVVLIMSDDQGWGETGYNGHPHLKTPVLDQMAATGLRLDRFYAASPVCTPTRASVMTGRHANRSGAFSWNWSIRPEEVTLAQILQDAGYRTGHFGKWHIGAVKKGSPLSPSAMGFDEYLSHDNFFELSPALSRNGEKPETIQGESSEVVVKEALSFVSQARAEQKPFFVVIWFGSPHDPYSGLNLDRKRYESIGPPLADRFAEITALDRAVGMFREGLDRLNVRDNTLLWFNSDNGITTEGVPEEQREDLFNGNLRGKKGLLFEGGVRVPCIIEWPNVITRPHRSDLAAVTSDILPTLLDVLGLKHPKPDRPLDGVSLKRLMVNGKMNQRPRPIGFWRYHNKPERDGEPWIADRRLTEMITTTARQRAKRARGEYEQPDIFWNYKHPTVRKKITDRAAWMDNRYKLLVEKGGKQLLLFDLLNDREETTDIAARHPQIVKRMKRELAAWQQSVERSLTGADY
ncbi:MAG: sulfatase-like hydrolase/transferase [Limisphaerales bacterium]